MPGRTDALDEASAQRARKPGGAASVLALQRMAGNRATGQLLARKPTAVAEQEKLAAEAEAASADYSEALNHTQRHFARVRDVLMLKSEVHDVAIRNYDTFGKLKDPPSLSDAIIGEIFSQVVGLIPGGAAIKAGLSGLYFVSDMAALQKDLDVMPIPGVSVEEEAKKGPSAAVKGKAEKHYERGKKGYEMGKAVVDKAKETQAKIAEAKEAEANAKELAGLQSGRIKDWSQAIQKVHQQEAAVTKWLQDAQRGKKNRGGMLALVKKRLGPLPEITDQLQDELERQYELALYAQKLSYVSVVKYSEHYGTESRAGAGKLEVDGKRISGPTYFRICDLLRAPQMWEMEAYVAERLNVKNTIRRERIPDPPGGARDF
jgi:hypothetical protein